MIEFILGIIVFLIACGLGFLVIAAGAMSDSSDATRIVTPRLRTIVGITGAIEIGLFLIWFAKVKGWR